MAPKRPFFGLRGNKLQTAIAAVCATDLLLFGYDQGVMGGLLTMPSFTALFPQICTTGTCTAGLTAKEQNHKAVLQGVSVGSYNLGCFAGALLILWLGNYLGRRRAIFCGSILMVIGAALQGSAFSLGHLIAGRFICGIGNGMNSSTVPVWQAECSKSHRRGQTILAELAIVVGGVMISYWLDFGFSYVPSAVAWRFPMLLQLVFSLSVVVSILTMPESPRWLVYKGREQEAVEVLSALHDRPIDDPIVLSELQAVQATIELTSKSIRDVFTMGKTKHFQRTCLAYGIQVLQQITGINLITYYAATIYENEIGLSGFMSRILAALNGTEYFLASIPAIFLVDRFGRRPLLLIGSVGMTASMAILAAMTSIGGSACGIVAAVFLFVFNTFFAFGWLSIPWLYPAECVPVEIRAQANALSTSANWIFNFMVVMITPVAFSSIGWRTYIIFTVFNAISIPIIYWCYPETACRSLEEMDVIFAKATSIFDSVKVAQTEPKHFGRRGEILRELVQDVRESTGIPAEKSEGLAVQQIEEL